MNPRWHAYIRILGNGNAFLLASMERLSLLDRRLLCSVFCLELGYLWADQLAQKPLRNVNENAVTTR